MAYTGITFPDSLLTTSKTANTHAIFPSSMAATNVHSSHYQNAVRSYGCLSNSTTTFGFLARVPKGTLSPRDPDMKLALRWYYSGR